ncbi:MAG: 3-phosphoshikimate 1-carboxyvinyltransferase [Ignavibacteriae bacterium]|nr:3-phosphoshikimate 1-carboxyvinyltransferase [Ignavibacteriota bacterium]
MIQEFRKANKVSGTLNLPGDKSISHRAVMFSSLAEGKSEIYNCLMSEDVISTINAFKAMGCKIEITDEKIVVGGKGIDGLQKPQKELYLGNSGTTTRLLAGILSAQKFPTVLNGDDSLSKRPMKRIIDPLLLMGADITGDSDCLPLKINPVEELKSLEYKLPMASAQVKSCVLLAGLFSDEKTCVIENKVSRNHTETMLGLEVVEENGIRRIYSSKLNFPKARNVFVPSDISTAAFFMILTLLSKNSELRLPNVSLNETRIGIISILKKMNGNIEYKNVKTLNGEKRGDIIVKSSDLINVEIPSEVIPNIIDEIPILAIAGLFAKGNFNIRNAKELRHKESDRISSVCNNLKLLGLDIIEYEDGFEILKNNSKSFVEKENITFESYDDHRIAMAFSVLSVLLKYGGSINDFECVNISNPNFLTQLATICF